MNKSQERSIFFAILCCCCLTIFVILLISIPAGYYIYETYFVCEGEPPSTPGLVHDWDGRTRYSGFVVKYRCNEPNNNEEVVQISDCVSGEWRIVMKKVGLCSEIPGQSLNCKDDPPMLEGMERIWDGVSRTIGTTVNYRCKNDPEQDRILIKVCTELVWKTTYKKPETCESLIQLRRCLGNPFPSNHLTYSNWDNKTRDVGTKIEFYCNDSPHSPVKQTVRCDIDYHWHMIVDTKENCFCSPPKSYPTPLQYNWDGKSRGAGVEVKYWCATSTKSTNFLVIKCSADFKWVVIERGDCTFLVKETLNFTDAVDYCSGIDSQIVAPKNDTEKDLIKNMLKEENGFDTTCNHRAFVGLRETTMKQWQVDGDENNFISQSSEMWFQVDEGQRRCSAMEKSSAWKLNNVLCTGMRICAMCEIDVTVSNPSRVCPPSMKSCFVVIATNRVEYTSYVKDCESLGGKIATPTNLYALQELIKIMKQNETLEKTCPSVYVGLVSKSRHYETIDGEEMTYGQFVSDRSRSMSRHCVVIHEKNNFNYVDEHCKLKSCSICSISGPAVGSVVQPHLNQFVSERSLLRQRHMGRTQCRQGWLTDGTGCFLFNETLVTESEARATCRKYYTDLASLNIVGDRQFISHHLIRYYSGTDNLMWYVDVFGGFTDDKNQPRTVNYDTNCTVIQLLPQFGWNAMDCTTKAAFICHD